MSVITTLTIEADSDTLTLVPSDSVRASELEISGPDIRAFELPWASRSGVQDETAHHGARTVTLVLTLLQGGSNIGDILDNLGKFLRPDRRPILKFTRYGQTERRVVLRPDQFSAPVVAANPNHVEVQLQWRAPDGIIEAASLSSGEANPQSAESGRAYNLTYARTYPASTGLGTVNVTNSGNTYAYPVFRVYGPCTDPRITSDTQEKALYFSGLTVSSGDYVEVSTSERTILLNSMTGSSLYSKLDFDNSEWFTLSPGVNVIRYHPVSSSSPSEAVIEWRHAYLM